MKQYTPEELNKLSKEEIVALLMQSQKEAALFKERLEELQMHLFGRSTERMECLGQESIFNRFSLTLSSIVISSSGASSSSSALPVSAMISS